jgi:hypothetical protein
MDAGVRSPASGETWPDMRWWGPSWSSRSTRAKVRRPAMQAWVSWFYKP